MDQNTGDTGFGSSVAITDTSGAVVAADSSNQAFTLFYRSCTVGSFNEKWNFCTACQAGTYSDKTAGFRSSCKSCVADTYSDGVGMTSINTCKPCIGGKYSDAGTAQISEAVCKSCIEGKYSDGVGRTSVDTCKTCETGQSNSGTGKTNCRSCVPGRTLKELPIVCVVCASGKYQPTVHLDSNVKCLECPVGRYIDDDEQDETKHDSVDKCLYCAKGYEFTTQTTPCEICSAGHYQNKDALVQSKCVACPVGRHIVDKKQDATEHDSEADYSYCPAGWEYISPTEKCLTCPGGRYQNDDASVETECKLCPAGLFNSDTRTNPQKHLSINNCLDCPTGYKFTSIRVSCQMCTAGRYEDQEASIELQCKDCPSGKFNGDNSVDGLQHLSIENCAACPSGWSSEKGAAVCIQKVNVTIKVGICAVNSCFSDN